MLHPLPRVNELGYDLDNDPRGIYFKQAAYGVPVRMALIAKVLGIEPFRARDRAPPRKVYGHETGLRLPERALHHPPPEREPATCRRNSGSCARRGAGALRLLRDRHAGRVLRASAGATHLADFAALDQLARPATCCSSRARRRRGRRSASKGVIVVVSSRVANIDHERFAQRAESVGNCADLGALHPIAGLRLVTF